MKAPIVILKKILPLWILAFSIQPVTAQVTDCFNFKEGKFKVSDANAGGIWVIERKGGIQVESNEGIKAVLQYKITWQNDCNFTMQLEKIIRNENNLPFPKGVIIQVKILKTAAGKYWQESSSRLYSGSLQTEVTKIQ